MSETFTLYKLIILYMLHKVDFPLTNAQIANFLLEKEYTTYFTLQQALGELMDSNLIRRESTHKRSLFHITEEGEETILFFHHKMSPALLEDIDTFLKEKQYGFKQETAVKADYFRNPWQEYSVRCQVHENGMDIIDLTITVPGKQEAETMANNWSKKSQDIYAMIMQQLL